MPERGQTWHSGAYVRGRRVHIGLQLDAPGADVGEQLRRDGHELVARAEVQRVLDHVGVEALLLVM